MGLTLAEQVVTRLSLEPGVCDLHWHLEEDPEAEAVLA
jgi:hypothetical protein